MFISGRGTGLAQHWSPRKVVEKAPSTSPDQNLSSARSWDQSSRDQLCLWDLFLEAALCQKGNHGCFPGLPDRRAAQKRGRKLKGDRTGQQGWGKTSAPRFCRGQMRSARGLWTHGGLAHWEGLPVVLAVMLEFPESVQKYELNHCTLFKRLFLNTGDNHNLQIFITSPIRLREN